MQIHEDNKDFLSAKRSQAAQKKHRKAYIYADDDDSTDDIINTSSADDNMGNLVSNRNMGVYRIIVCVNLLYSIIFLLWSLINVFFFLQNPNMRKGNAAI